MQYSEEDPLAGASNAGYEKIDIFDQYLALCRKYKTGPYYYLNAHRKPHSSFRIVLFSMTLGDL